VQLEPVQFLLGPLAGPECRRALGRSKWLVWRVLAAIPALLALLAAIWAWWLLNRFMPPFEGTYPIRAGLTAVDWIGLAIALVLGPAVLAGALAGDKDRGTLAMLLASRVNPREIVLAKLTGRLSIVGVLLLAGLPALCILAALESMPLGTLLLHVALPVAVAFGGGGMALAASAVARRGRDALMAVYFLDLALFLGPLFGVNFIPQAVSQWLIAINPFVASTQLTWGRQTAPAVASIAVWLLMGLAAITWAAVRLGPVYLRQLDGSSVRRKPRRRRDRPVSDEHPMLWKELHIEQGQKFHGLLRWLGWLVVSVIVLTSLALLGLFVWETAIGAPPPLSAAANPFLSPAALSSSSASLPPWAASMADLLRSWAALSALPLSWLMQWAIGLRAAVAIASEREQHTWDSLLISPLEGQQIVWPKIGGSLYAMRGLLAVALFSWTVAAVSGAIAPTTMGRLVAFSLVLCTFMAAVGVWASITSSTVTRAMTLALGVWLAAGAISYIVAVLVASVVALVVVVIHMYMVSLGLAQLNAAPAFPISFGTGIELLRLVQYTGATLLLGWYCRRRFDELAGRASGRRLRYVPAETFAPQPPYAPAPPPPPPPTTVAATIDGSAR
jgi:ABC-type transport system involved in multi-copper enzyme maturation permease subunit